MKFMVHQYLIIVLKVINQNRFTVALTELINEKVFNNIAGRESRLKKKRKFCG